MNTERAALLLATAITAALLAITLSPSTIDPVERHRITDRPDAPRVTEPDTPSVVAPATTPPIARTAAPPAPQRPIEPTELAIETLPVGDTTRPVIAGEVVFVFGPIPADEARDRLAAAGFALLEYEPIVGAARAGLPAGWRVADGLAHAETVAALPEAAPNALAWAADANPVHILETAALDTAALDTAALDALLAAGDGVSVTHTVDNAFERPELVPGDPDDGLDPWAPPTDAERRAAQRAVRLEGTLIARLWQLIVDVLHAGDPIVAVVDSGVLSKSAVLPFGAFIRSGPYDSVTTLAARDFVRDHALALDENQHGTHVASTIIRSSGNRTRLMPVKVLDRLAIGTEYDVARGMLHAVERGADIINLSLTFGLYYVPSPLFAEVLDRCQQGDVLVVAAAGNDGARTVTYPAALRGVIAVGADRPDVAAFANRGAALDLVAPAGALPAENAGIGSESFRLYRPAQPATVRLVGTSMAAAAVTGQIARIMHDLERRDLLPEGPPGTRVDFLRYVVTHSAAPLGDTPFDPAWGMGNVDHDAALALADRLVTEDLVSSTAGERIGVAAQTSVFLEQTTLDGGTAIRGVAVVEAIAHDGRPLADATLHGDWEGSARGPASCTTDAWGRCVLAAAPIALPPGEASPVLVGLTLHRAISADAAHDVRPAERYHAPRAASLGDTSVVLQPIARADLLDADLLALLDELDPLTGQPLYCLGDTCPGYTPEHGDPDDLFRISHRRIYLATRYGGGTPTADSVLADRALVPSYQFRRHGRALQGGGLVLAFNDAFLQAAAVAFGDDLQIVHDGLRLGSSGPGDPLLWVNDLTADVIAEGAGMMTSGVSIIGYSLPLWSTQMFYVVDVGGAGMMTSGVSITFSSDIDYFTYNLALLGQTFATFGSALLDSTHPPFALLAVEHLSP